MRRVLLIIMIVLLPAQAYAYRMPAYAIAEGDWGRSAESVFAEHKARLDAIDADTSIARLENQRRCHNCRLSRREQKRYKEYQAIKVPYEFWRYVTDLKKDLVAMAGSRAQDEADRMAKEIIQKLYDLSREYKVAGSALIQNALINMGAKEKGFCYHYTYALKTMLEKEKWRHFAFHWGAAHDRTFLENNGLIITAKGKPFETGIVVDAWRTASRPYWHAVKGDRFPWKELKNVELTYDLTK